MHQAELTRAGDDRYREFLLVCPHSFVEDDVLHVHGSPRNPLHEYVFPEDVHNPRKMSAIGARFPRLCFCGHTHVPGVFVEQGPGHWEHVTPLGCGGEWRLDGRKTLINVGSVGQPRDGDPRAGYVLFDGELVRFVRLRYDVATTIRKVRRNPALDDFQGDRLGEGH